MPAAKKHPSVRARANRASTAAVLPAAPVRRTAPKLPSLPDGDGDRIWSPLTAAWWRDLWRSPMSTEYHDSDKHQLIVLAILMDDYFTASSRTMRAAISAEIRQHRTAFGLTPYDRRRLEWTIEQAEDAKVRGKTRRGGAAAPVEVPADDPRRHLTAVS